MGRGALQLPTQMAVDTVRVVDEGVLNAVASAREALKQPTKDDDALRALEEGLLDPC
ncbi:hypothetical protein ALP29_200552 [Pseudomonas syringae pv. avii]|uniref:Uncharacterized protein n=1 Tax=Pseudomonas syringae pv. avii TaxID=663959 RepID=A0A3M5UFX0_PSESX|nr:hypothetical protein ALP29_200552 [Pseudomonas syringae pv. avii]